MGFDWRFLDFIFPLYISLPQIPGMQTERSLHHFTFGHLWSVCLSGVCVILSLSSRFSVEIKCIYRTMFILMSSDTLCRRFSIHKEFTDAIKTLKDSSSARCFRPTLTNVELHRQIFIKKKVPNVLHVSATVRHFQWVYTTIFEIY